MKITEKEKKEIAKAAGFLLTTAIENEEINKKIEKINEKINECKIEEDVNKLSGTVIASDETIRKSLSAFMELTPFASQHRSPLALYNTIKNTTVYTEEGIEEKIKLIRIFDLDNDRYIDLTLSGDVNTKSSYSLEVIKFKKEFSDKELGSLLEIAQQIVEDPITNFNIKYIGKAVYEVHITTGKPSSIITFIFDIVNEQLTGPTVNDISIEDNKNVFWLYNTIKRINGLHYGLYSGRNIIV